MQMTQVFTNIQIIKNSAETYKNSNFTKKTNETHI